MHISNVTKKYAVYQQEIRTELQLQQPIDI